MDTNQRRRTSGAEEALVKQFLESREDAPLVLRNHFLQFELTEDEREFLNGINSDLIPVLVKLISPVLDREIPLGQQASKYSGLIIEQMNPDVGNIHLQATDIINAYLNQRIDALKGDREDEGIILKDLPEPIENGEEFERVINVIAHNRIIPTVEDRIISLVDLVQEPEETDEERADRLKADSSE